MNSILKHAVRCVFSSQETPGQMVCKSTRLRSTKGRISPDSSRSPASGGVSNGKEDLSSSDDSKKSGKTSPKGSDKTNIGAC